MRLEHMVCLGLRNFRHRFGARAVNGKSGLDHLHLLVQLHNWNGQQMKRLAKRHRRSYPKVSGSA